MEIATTIIPGYKYTVWGGQVTYNTVTLAPGDSFYGIAGVTTYAGPGFASEIIELNSASLEILNDPCDDCFPEDLTLNAVCLEVVSPQNGTIFPENLRIFSTALEVVAVKTGGARIIYSIN